MRALSTLCVASLQVSVFLATAIQPVVAQSVQLKRQAPRQSPLSPPPPPAYFQSPVKPPAPPPGTEITPSGSQGTPQLGRYLLGPGDAIGVTVQRPPGRYLLGPGDAIGVTVQRFPDLSFQAQINPEGNITVPLLGTVSLKGLSLQQAQEKIRTGLNRYVIDPIVSLSLVLQRPELNFQAQINPEGNITVPQVGVVSLQGLTLEEAQEKIRLSLSKILVEQDIIAVSLIGQRPVQITVSGEVSKPGIYPINSSSPRVGDALVLAGGSTNAADLRHVEVRRKLIDGSIVSQKIDLYTPLQNAGEIPNLRLQDGDAIVIPRREIATGDNYDRNLVSRSTLAAPQIRIRVLNYAAGGLVTLPLPNGSTFIDALTGINLDTTNLSGVALVRFDPERGKAVTQKINAKKALQGDLSQNVPLQDNDVIVVGRNLIGKITNAISLITQPFYNIESFIRFFDIFNGNFP
ncbi:polysaccharide biosynthesis/export family protein [Aetokthonos hydrillicola Thurmond2011]|jgi:polysaccharide export outer membrane protein|uniref:Polysaccharide biosynthesis/export family protein n=1 Tax=Aetokthonos hydrillicola Thurmond2011 TaxID=2712845 RepID=A0AAP5IEG9_9CYAN|nr:polysaccharide biosynthesis/export family protein [Aetokthonos hydrillicola]MBO3462363.1 sugar ABC transporter substrate-binding protein [Aetokthonos hydrillicola CCALA 1050]MBW4584220.1 polysaccharide biosynthesis/export family protein [Aetokthonos hydrillicola CCALA 1050]MDR9898572.1 polysaccharide biosynthesis/export family protein [Aetokthonos hydrillicola Thurmond2011]